MANAAPSLNLLYHQWDCLAALLFVGVALLGGVWWVLGLDHAIVKQAALDIKQSLTTIFMNTVHDEVRRWVKLLDEHLPFSLSQETAERPYRSRFDHFCQLLRKADPAEFEQDRGQYSEIIRIAFGGVIAQTISRLMEGATSGSFSMAGEVLNPTGLRFEMEGVQHLKFAFVSRISAMALQQERRYHRRYTTAVVSWIIAFLLILLLWIPMLVDSRWAGYACIVMLAGATITVIWGLSAVLSARFCERWLQKKAQLYGEGAGVMVEFDDWTRSQA